jgi:hypothetical protein
LIIYYFDLRTRRAIKAIYKPKKIAEKKAPVAANPLLKVRFEIWVKTLILISIKEK